MLYLSKNCALTVYQGRSFVIISPQCSIQDDQIDLYLEIVLVRGAVLLVGAQPVDDRRGGAGVELAGEVGVHTLHQGQVQGPLNQLDREIDR